MMTRLGKLIGVLAFTILAPVASGAEPGDVERDRISTRDATVDGAGIHFMTAGRGPAVILLHGYAETSRMWKPIIPVLAKSFTVIAPDLPGIGDSAIPASGLDMKSAATRIHGLVRQLG